MNVSLTPELVGFVKEQVAGGMYHSSSEVVREGLRLLKEQKEDRRVRLEELRKKIAVGIEQADRGEVAPLDIEEIKSEGRRRMTEMQQFEREAIHNG